MFDNNRGIKNKSVFEASKERLEGKKTLGKCATCRYFKQPNKANLFFDFSDFNARKHPWGASGT